VDIFGELTEDVSGVYLSGLPVLHEATTPVPAGCMAMPAFKYSNDSSTAEFGRQSPSYIAYNISGQEALLSDEYV